MQNTRKTPPKHGPGDHAIDEFVKTMVAINSGSATKVAHGLRISFPNEPDRFIAYEPEEQAQWESRLKWVEKQSAAYLLGAPILYGLEWNAKRRKTSNVRALRLSIGLSLSMGASHPKRYTCILKHGDKNVFVGEGGHLPNVTGANKLLLTSLPAWAEKELERFAPAVLTACELFQKRAEVQVATATLDEKFTTELSDLDRLYRRKQGMNDRLYGLPAAGTEGSVAIEAELRRLQGIVLDRYHIRLRLRVLSLGVFEGDVPHTMLTI
jgi:hypothetical protein